MFVSLLSLALLSVEAKVDWPDTPIGACAPSCSDVESNDCRECCQNFDHEKDWKCGTDEAADCCTEWGAHCFWVRSEHNFNHGCKDCGALPGDAGDPRNNCKYGITVTGLKYGSYGPFTTVDSCTATFSTPSEADSASNRFTCGSRFGLRQSVLRSSTGRMVGILSCNNQGFEIIITSKTGESTTTGNEPAQESGTRCAPQIRAGYRADVEACLESCRQDAQCKYASWYLQPDRGNPALGHWCSLAATCDEGATDSYPIKTYLVRKPQPTPRRTPRPTPPPVRQPTNRPTPLVTLSCRDKNRSCPRWASEGECVKNPSYMSENCKDSCRLCHCLPNPRRDPEVQFYSAEWACDQGRSGMSCRDAPTVCRTGARAATWAFSKYYDVFAPTGGTCDFSGTAYMSDSLPYPECVYGLVPEPTRRPTPRPIQPNRNQPIRNQPIPEQPTPNEQPTSRPTPPIGTIADRVHCIPDPSDDPVMTNYAVDFVCGSLSDMDCDDAPFNCRADDKAATWAFSKYYDTVQMKRLEERVALLGTGAAELDSSVQQMRAECMLETAILSNKLPYPECVYGLVNPNGSGESNGSGGDPDATDETEKETPAEETAPRPEATTPRGCGDCGEGGFCNFDAPLSFCEMCPSDFQTCRTDGLPELGALDCLARCSEFIRIPAPPPRGDTATARTQSDEDKETKILGLPVNTFIIIVAVVSTLILGCCAVLLVCAFCGPSERDGRNDEYFIPKERSRTKRRRRRERSLSYDRSDDARSDDDRDGRKLERARV